MSGPPPLCLNAWEGDHFSGRELAYKPLTNPARGIRALARKHPMKHPQNGPQKQPVLTKPLPQEAMELLQVIGALVKHEAQLHLIQVPSLSPRFKDGVPVLFTARDSEDGKSIELVPLCIMATEDMWRGTMPDPKFPTLIPKSPQQAAAVQRTAGGTTGLALPGTPGFEQAAKVSGVKL